jgi:hypothetical protein
MERVYHLTITAKYHRIGAPPTIAEDMREWCHKLVWSAGPFGRYEILACSLVDQATQDMAAPKISRAFTTPSAPPSALAP